MKMGSERSDENGGVDPKKEAAYWREQHSKQPCAKNHSYEQFEHAYRTGYNAFSKYPGKSFDEVEKEVALDYEEARPGSALPWDTVRPAVNSVTRRPNPHPMPSPPTPIDSLDDPRVAAYRNLKDKALDRELGPQEHRHQERRARRRDPRASEPAATRGLFVGDRDEALRFARDRALQEICIRRLDGLEPAHVAAAAGKGR